MLIANRGEIACRVTKATEELGLKPIVIYTEADALSLHVKGADHKVCLGPDKRAYTDINLIVKICKEQKVAAVHPGYGFLSENVEFATAINDSGIQFLGPDPVTFKMFSLKHTARAIAVEAKVPVLPGSSVLTTADEAGKLADGIGYPVLLKATGGGGGIGIYICNSRSEVVEMFPVAARQGQANFGNSEVFLEKYVQAARHIEVQIFGDGKGKVVHLGERECSIQRRHQKVVEETPSPFSSPEFREGITSAAVRLGQYAKYRSAGTIEFLVDNDTGKFYFLEVNTRLQVEHGITEYVCRQDLVQWMIRLQVPGLKPPDLDAYSFDNRGAAIECRINAENPSSDYSPSAGTLGEVTWPEMTNVRVDTWVETGSIVTPHYDSLLAKVMVFSPKGREDAIKTMQAALAATRLKGIPTNLELCQTILSSDKFGSGVTTTDFLTGFNYKPHAIQVTVPGMRTSVQDWPGRTKLWSVGVPPSGPVDRRSFRFGNALVANASDAAGLEFAIVGPTLKFHAKAVVAVTGAEFDVDLDGTPIKMWTSLEIPAGSTLKIGGARRTGGICGYLAVNGGLDVPLYLGSRATFPSGGLGGVQGRPLKAGDLIPLGRPATRPILGTVVPDGWISKLPQPHEGDWSIGVLPSPNAAPDFFTEEDLETFYSTPYTVHYNSNRLGVRLEGPAPKWARSDGGEGGTHPSNVHDHVYAIGTINFTGNTPVVLMPDGPSLGGFVCPATVPTAELWKLGQVSAGVTLRFKKLTLQEADALRCKTNKQIELLTKMAAGDVTSPDAQAQIQESVPPKADLPETKVVLLEIGSSLSHPGMQVRLAGDRCVLVEYGPMELDMKLRVRVWALQKELAHAEVEGLVETGPGVRSVMVEYDPNVLGLSKLLGIIERADAVLQPLESSLPTRIIKLPIAFDDRCTRGAIDRYMRSSRNDAPYLPSNIDFVAANNGLPGGGAAVKGTLKEASYMVLGLGDVYLGAPCAVPLDPRHRLVVPKYNPARTFTPEGAVGLGGAYLCIYSMNSPGGYQLVGRTLPIWNTWGRSAPFSPDTPWLLRIFDQIKFVEVSEDELEKQRAAFANGQLAIDITETTFDLAAYNEFLADVALEARDFRKQQLAASKQQTLLDDASLERLAVKAAAGNAPNEEETDSEAVEGGVDVSSTITANVWEVLPKVGDFVKVGQKIILLEAMKMEVVITAPVAGVLAALRVEAGQLVQQQDVLLVIVPEDKAA